LQEQEEETMDKEILNLSEAAELLRISRRALRKAAARGEIPGRLIARKWRFSRFALHQWLNQQQNPYLKHAGALADNPLWNDVMAHIEAERKRQREAAYA